MYAWQSGSKYEIWLQATMTGPCFGMFSVPMSFQRKNNLKNGRSTARTNAYIGSTHDLRVGVEKAGTF